MPAPTLGPRPLWTRSLCLPLPSDPCLTSRTPLPPPSALCPDPVPCRSQVKPMGQNSHGRAPRALAGKGAVPALPGQAGQQDSGSSSEDSDSGDSEEEAATTVRLPDSSPSLLAPRRAPPRAPALSALASAGLTILVSHCRRSPPRKSSQPERPRAPAPGPLRRPGLQPPRSRPKGRRAARSPPRTARRRRPQLHLQPR